MLQQILNIVLAIFNRKVIKNQKPIPQNVEPTVEPEEELDYLFEHMKNLYYQHGVEWKEVNVFGLRQVSLMQDDIYNDYIGLGINGKIHLFEATTDPGVYYTHNPINEKGVAHLCLGYYQNAYRIGIHGKGRKSEHEALIQVGPLKIWRDGNNNFRKDDSDVIETGYFGINIHRSAKSKNRTTIGKWSAGCQAFRKVKDFNKFLKLIKQSETYSANNKCKFDYLLINIDEVPEGLMQ